MATAAKLPVWRHGQRRLPARGWGTLRPVYRPRRATQTPLYPVVQHHLETFLAQAAEVPPWVERDFRGYLECGILAYGFARARCEECGHERLIPFSCKGRGVCPSCNLRRMCEVAAHLTDHVLPHLPARQWVLSVPKRLRPYLQHDTRVAGAVLRTFLGAIRRILRQFACRGLLDEADADDMLSWQGSGGLNVDASVRIEGEDRAGIERLVRYCARPPFALERLHAFDGTASLASPDGRLPKPPSPAPLPPHPACLPNLAQLRPLLRASAGPPSSRGFTRCFRSYAQRVAAT